MGHIRRRKSRKGEKSCLFLWIAHPRKTDLHPRVPVTLIFPSHEKGFELESVIQALERRKNVEIIRTSYRHGFMNKKSLNYADDAYHDFCQWLKTTLRASPQEKEK